VKVVVRKTFLLDLKSICNNNTLINMMKLILKLDNYCIMHAKVKSWPNIYRQMR